MDDSREIWYEEDAGPLVRLHAVTRGRGRSGAHDLTMTTQIVDNDLGGPLRRGDPEYVAIVQLCRTPHSVAEVSAKLRLPLTMTKVLIADLIDDGRLIFRSSPPKTDGDSDVNLLRSLLAGIRSL